MNISINLPISIQIIFFTYCILLGILLRNIRTGKHENYARIKILVSLGFILLGLFSYIEVKNALYFSFLPAYICCFAGDVLLGICRDKDGKVDSRRFLSGVVFFAMAHVCFIAQLLKMLDMHITVVSIIPGIVLSAATMIASKSKFFNYGKKAPYCAIYSLFVGFFGGLGIQMYLTYPDTIYMNLISYGALMFLTSDCILAFKYFFNCEKKTRKALAQTEITLYYIAMLLLSIFTIFS